MQETTYRSARAGVRLATDYLLRWTEISRQVHGSDLIYALAFSALWSGNISHLRTDLYDEATPYRPIQNGGR